MVLKTAQVIRALAPNPLKGLKMALPDEIHVGKTYVNPRWSGSRTVVSLEKKLGLLNGTRKTVVHFVCNKSSRTGHADLTLFAHKASIQDLQSDQSPAPAKIRRAARLTKSQLRKLATKAGIFRVEGAAGEELLKQLAAFAAGVADHYAEKCTAIAIEHQQEEGPYAAGKKAGALECAQALSLPLDVK